MTGATPDINQLLQHYFDRVLVLTVRRFKERHKRIKKRLSGISFDFFYGVDKNELDAATIRNNYLYDKKASLAVQQVFKELNTGELACSLSHRNLYDLMIFHGWERVLIFEDDVVPDLNNLPYLSHTMRELPDNWELLYLGYTKNEKVTFKLRVKKYWYMIMCLLGISKLPLKMVKNLLPKKFSSHLMHAGFHDCTHAYAITLEAAKKLAEAQTPVKYRADNLLTSLVLKEKLNAFISRYQFFNQEVFANKAERSYIRNAPKLHAQ
jgi:glycosyl transferase, family 25